MTYQLTAGVPITFICNASTTIVPGAFMGKITQQMFGCALRISDRDGCISGIGEYCPKCRIRGQLVTPVIRVEASTPKSPSFRRVSGNQDSTANLFPCVLPCLSLNPQGPTTGHSSSCRFPTTWVLVTGRVRLSDLGVLFPTVAPTSVLVEQVPGTVGSVSWLSGKLRKAFRPATADGHVPCRRPPPLAPVEHRHLSSPR